MAIDDLILWLRQDPANEITTDADFGRFCELGIEFYERMVSHPVAAGRAIWDESELALAMREGAEGGTHIDFDQVSRRDHKVGIMYRKFGFKGLEGAIEELGVRRAFALARLVTCYPDNLVGIVPFASSTKAWLERVTERTKAASEQTSEALEIQCIGPQSRHRIDRTTWVTDAIAALHEQILPDATWPCTVYVPEVNVLVFGPLPRLVRRWLFGTREQWHPQDCLVALVWALALVHTYPESMFRTLLPDPDHPDRYEAMTRKSSIEAAADYLEENQMLDAAREMRAIVR